MRQDDVNGHTPTPWAAELRPSQMWHIRGPSTGVKGDRGAVVFTGSSLASFGSRKNAANVAVILRAVNGFDVMHGALRFIAAGHGCPAALAEDALKQAGLSND